jgi:hypothetical protein
MQNVPKRFDINFNKTFFRTEKAGEAGLPDGIFQTKKSNLGKFWRDLQWNMLVYVFYGHLVYFVAIWYILWLFGIVYSYLVYFSPFWNYEPMWKILYYFIMFCIPILFSRRFLFSHYFSLQYSVLT